MPGSAGGCAARGSSGQQPRAGPGASCLCRDIRSLGVAGGQRGGGCSWPGGQASIVSLVLVLGPGPVWNLVVVVCYVNNMGFYCI